MMLACLRCRCQAATWMPPAAVGMIDSFVHLNACFGVLCCAMFRSSRRGSPVTNGGIFQGSAQMLGLQGQHAGLEGRPG